MLITICVTLSYIVLAFLLVIFIGYWTGANYFFKFNKKFIQIFSCYNAVAWFLWLFTHGIAAITQTRSEEFTYNLSYGIVGAVNITMIGMFIAAKGFEWFEISRQYFWSKRGR